MAIVEIALTQGKIALIDEADLPLVSQYQWHAVRRDCTWYACSSKLRRKGGTCVYMHRLLMNAPPDLDVDHRDGNGLNCTRDNMRLATNAENRCNTRSNRGASKYKGVSIVRSNANRIWHASISVKDTIKHLGTYHTEEEAARAYNAAAIQHYGEFANLNTIDGLTYEESIVPPVRNPKRGRPPKDR